MYLISAYLSIYLSIYQRDGFNKFPDFFVHAFKIVVDTWKIQYIIAIHLMRWLINFYDFYDKQLQQQLEYTQLKPDCHSCWI